MYSEHEVDHDQSCMLVHFLTFISASQSIQLYFGFNSVDIVAKN